MKECVIQLTKIITSNFDPKTGVGDFIISYNKDNSLQSYNKKILLENPEAILEDILKEVKKREKIENFDESDFIGSIFIIRVKDEEKIEEKLYNFFARMCEKSRTVRKMKNHTEYMKMLDEIKSQKLIFSNE